MLKHHADILAYAADVFVGDEVAVIVNLARSGDFEVVDGTEESGFARAGGTEDGDFFAGGEGEINVTEDVVITV